MSSGRAISRHRFICWKADRSKCTARPFTARRCSSFSTGRTKSSGYTKPCSEQGNAYARTPLRPPRILSYARVPRERFLAFIATRFRAAQYVIDALCFRLDETNEKLASFAAADMGARVARVILHMSTCYGQHVGGKAVELGVPLTQQELANVIGAARQTVNGIIQSLKADGIISVTKQHMRVEDEARLRRIAMRDTGPDED